MVAVLIILLDRIFACTCSSFIKLKKTYNEALKFILTVRIYFDVYGWFPGPILRIK